MSGAEEVVVPYTYVTPQFWTPNNEPHNAWLTVTAQYDQTVVNLPGAQFTIAAGQTIQMINNFYGGTIFSADKPVQAFCWTNTQYYARGFTLLPYIRSGTSYRMPKLTPTAGVQYASICAFETGTIVTIGGLPYYPSPGYPVFMAISAGVPITSNKPVVVYAHNNERDWVRSGTLEPL
ncbi:MAG: hypothetical protein HBSIN02_09250 [Bacteroidia bacterium]|nr:MAG: hypothetical protein HBSIN02_09250 [Bacteroidia bacterium]